MVYDSLSTEVSRIRYVERHVEKLKHFHMTERGFRTAFRYDRPEKLET